MGANGSGSGTVSDPYRGGHVVLTPDLELDTDCFASCGHLTSLVIPSGSGYVCLGKKLLQSCRALVTVTIGDVAPYSDLYFGTFDDCPNLKKLIFTGIVPGQPQISLQHQR